MDSLYKQFSAFRTVLLFIFVLILPWAPSYGNDALFTVEGVDVDITSDSAARARQQAVSVAQDKAFKVLVSRLLSERDVEMFQWPDNDIISTFVRDFEITQEQLSTVRYVAQFTFRFKSKDVKDYLRWQGLSYTDMGSAPVLVLPFYQNGDQTVLWQEPNPWMQAWRSSKSTSKSLVPTVVPLGDLEDVSAISDNEYEDYNPENLKTIVGRYGTGEAIVMLAVPGWFYAGGGQQDPTDPDKLMVILYRTDRGIAEFADSFNISKPELGRGENLFEAAVNKARDTLQRDWKSRTVVDPNQTNSLMARVSFSSLEKWVRMKNAIAALSVLDNHELLSVSTSEAYFALYFNGDEDRLRTAMERQGLVLSSPHIDFNSLDTAGQSSPLIYEITLR